MTEQEHYKKRIKQLWEEWKEKYPPSTMTIEQGTRSEEKFYAWAEQLINSEWDSKKDR